MPRSSKLLVASLVFALLAVGPAASAVGIVRSQAWRTQAKLLGASAGVPRVVLQSGPESCGPAVLSTLLGWAGRPIPEAELLRFADLRAGGITLAEFTRLADTYALPGSWYDVPRRELGRLPLPFVAHLRSSGGHFVIVRALDRRFALVADPARGLVVERRARLARAWTGRVFLLESGLGRS